MMCECRDTEVMGCSHLSSCLVMVVGSRAEAVASFDRSGRKKVEPSRDSFEARAYPLVRSIYIYLNRKPGTPVEPKLLEFLRYVLSREGQAVVADGSGFLPLPADVARAELRKLE